MPQVLPFSALRYSSSAAPDLSAVMSPPYDVISAPEAAELRASSPHNVIHLELPSDREGEPGSRYEEAARILKDWCDHTVLAAEDSPSYYLHETRFWRGDQQHRRRDLICALGVEPWSTGQVLPHEHTLPGAKADRLALLRATHANLSPIWVLYRKQPDALERAWAVAGETSPDRIAEWKGEEHRLWVVSDPASVRDIEQEFRAGPPVYIADGHHRYETALFFKGEAESGLPGAGATMAVLTWADDPGLYVVPTHRLLRIGGLSLDASKIEERWGHLFEIDRAPAEASSAAEQVEQFLRGLAESERPCFAMFGPEPIFTRLTLRDRHPPAGVLPADRSDAWKSLDVSILHEIVLDPLVSESGKEREQALGYTRDPREAVAAVESGEASLALFLNPPRVQQVLAIADAKDRMPEKSTYFYPKPPAGLVIRDLRRD